MQPNRSARILLYDLEAYPATGRFWGHRMYDQNIIKVVDHKMICSVAYKWLNESQIYCHALPHYFKKPVGYVSNKRLLKDFHKAYVNADIVVTHNGNQYDEKELHQAFFLNDFKDPPPHHSVDTLKIFRSRFRFVSNRLDDLAKRLDVGKKHKHSGYGMWEQCMKGDAKSWSEMILYNMHDVRILERVYLKVRAWDRKHPNLSNFTRTWTCPTCESENIQHRGKQVYPSGHKQRYHCQDCGAWSMGKMIRKSR